MSVSVDVTFSQGDLKLLAARFEAAASEVPILSSRMLMRIGDETETALKDATPVGTGRTGGHLDESYTVVTDETSMVLSTDQGGKLDWVRYGTSTPITPKRARYLVSPELPHPMAWVHGQRANDFVTPVTDNIATYIEAAVEPFVEELWVLFFGG